MNQEQIVSLIRQIMLSVGGGLVTKGYLDAGTLDAIVGAILILGGSAWAIYTRRKTGLILSTAGVLKPGERIVLNDAAKAEAIPSPKVVGPARG